MKIFKYAVWIIVLFLIQTVIANEIQIMSLCPDVILPFLVLTALREDSFKTSTAVAIVCAVMSGALCGRNFTFVVLFYTYVSAIVFNMRKFMGMVPDFMRYLLWTFMAGTVSEIISYLILYMSFKWFLKGLILYMIPAALYTTVIAAVLYPLMRSTLYGQGNGKKQLIVK